MSVTVSTPATSGTEHHQPQNPHPHGTDPADRRAGILLPLFSIRTPQGWGLGEIADLPRLARWAGPSGLSILQLLPVNEVAGGETSPYAAASAFAIDPVYLSLDDTEDFAAVGGQASLSDEDRQLLEQLRGSPIVRWRDIWGIKGRAIDRAYAHFRDKEWLPGTVRRKALERFIDEHRAWIGDYALFKALHGREHKAWWDWPEPLKTRQPAALDQARAELADEILKRQWLQWLLDEQWHRARADARALGLALKGDLPFMVGGDSADVWSRQKDFLLDRRVGTPPDAFSATGQDWGLPAYDWDVQRQNQFAWLRARAERSGSLFDLYRIDHVIGLYRTWTRPANPRPKSERLNAAPANNGNGNGNVNGNGNGAENGEAEVDDDPPEGRFSPAKEKDQIALGETVVGIFEGYGEVVAEDLGMVPEFLRPSLRALGVPGYKVLRWEKKDGTFLDPATWPELSVATNGSHDIETNAEWWDALPPEERKALVELPGLTHLDPEQAFDDQVRDALLQVVYDAPSALTINPLQDLLGTRERVNVPGTVADTNWCYRMDRDLAALAADRPTRDRLAALAEGTRRTVTSHGASHGASHRTKAAK
jgi:4-alpha-glucanotransferase